MLSSSLVNWSRFKTYFACVFVRISHIHGSYRHQHSIPSAWKGWTPTSQTQSQRPGKSIFPKLFNLGNGQLACQPRGHFNLDAIQQIFSGPDTIRFFKCPFSHNKGLKYKASIVCAIFVTNERETGCMLKGESPKWGDPSCRCSGHYF